MHHVCHDTNLTEMTRSLANHLDKFPHLSISKVSVTVVTIGPLIDFCTFFSSYNKDAFYMIVSD